MADRGVLVTGGAGFIGSHFVHHVLARSSWRVLTLDALTYAGRRENLAGVMDHHCHTFVQGRIEDEGLLRSLLKEEKISLVVNFAAESHVDRSIEHSLPFSRTNSLGQHCLMEACREAKIERFLQISTDEVYGSCQEELFHEDTPLRPSSPYAASKAGADCMVAAYYNTYAFPGLISRSCNAFGPRQYPEKLIPRLILRALHGLSLPLYGHGRHSREWIEVGDLCRALYLLLKKGKPGERYVIGTGEERSNLQVAKAILDILGLPYDRVRFVSDRLGHDHRYALNSQKIKREMEWKPEKSFRQGLKDTILWYREHREWWQSLWKGGG